MKARIVGSPKRPSRPFKLIRPGEFVVSTTSGSVGVKTVQNTIVWVNLGPQSRFGELGNVTHPHPDREYYFPTDVAITL